jgi:acyl-[acyl-carrier-protein]-phospholipid O-acyltransferase / long-chain-fatty-acid--[acyl-carrier-protein] ligase
MHRSFFHELADGLRTLHKDRHLKQAVRALACYGIFAGFIIPVISAFFHDILAFQPLWTLGLVLLITSGFIAGGFLSCRISDQKVELGIMPLGGLIIALVSFFMAWKVHEVLAALTALFLLSIGGGLFVIPLSRFLRYRAIETERYGVIIFVRTLWLVTFFFGTAAFFALEFFFDLSSRTYLAMTGGLVAVFMVYFARVQPYPFIRLCVWFLTHSAYRLRVVNKEVIPHSGGALVVANHLSFVDVLFLIVSTSRRVRFVTAPEIYNNRWVGPLCRAAGAFVLSPKNSPKKIARTLGDIRAAVRNGEIVCLFPEGQVSRTGNTLRFNRGIEHIMRDLAEPIIPAYLDRVWGSMWSFIGGKFRFKLPRVLPHPITIVFGQPLSSSTKAFDIREAVIELGAGAFRYRLEGNMTLPELFFNDMRRDPFSLCVADSTGRKLSRLKTFIGAYALAQKLRSTLKDEKHVGVFLPPSAGGAIVNVALSILRKVVVNLNYTASRDCLKHAVEQCGMRYCLTSRLMLEKLQVQSPAEPIFVDDLVKEVKGIDRLLALLVVAFPSRTFAHRMIFGSWKNLDNNELATIVFTSGSTGLPKGVMLTHANIASNLGGLYQIFHIQPGDGIMGVLPFFHSFGYTATLWFPLVGGMFAVYHTNPLDAQVVGEMTRGYRPTILIATPTFLSSYTRRCEKEDFASLHYVVVGAEKLKSTITRAFEDKFGIMPLEGYGCTELSPVVSINLPDFREHDVHQKAQKRGTIGLPLPGIAVRIVDPDTLERLGPGQEGLLLIKGGNVMKGYLGDPKKTAEVIKDGWYQTGDIAYLDMDGFITITDRLSRFSKIAGEMVPHMRVEDAIHSHLNAAEQVCVVASVPDEKKGEKLVVLTAAELDPSKIIEGLRAAGLPNLWVPEAKMFFKIDAIPLLGSGKLDLAAVKQLAQSCAAGMAKS